MFAGGLKQCIGAELKVLAKDQFSCRYCVLKIQKNELVIEDKQVIEGSLGTIVNKLPKLLPVALTISGKGILFKSVETATGDGHLLEQAFPAINADDFYTQLLEEGNTGHVALARKALIDDLLAKFAAADVVIAQVGLSAFSITHIVKLLNVYGETLQFDGHLFTLTTDRQLKTYQFETGLKSPFLLKIGDEVVEETQILPYAMGFQLLLNAKLQSVKATINSVDIAFANRLANAGFKQKAMYLLMASFMTLLFSYGIFSYYHAKNETLVAAAGMQTKTLDTEEQLKKQLQADELNLEQLGWNNGFNYAFLTEQLGNTMPKQLRLNSIQLQPGKFNSNDASFTGRIAVVGATADLMALNNWVYLLRELNWVKNVQLLKYVPLADTTQYTFKLEINY